MGDNQVIHSPDIGDVVKVSNMDAVANGEQMTYRRIVSGGSSNSSDNLYHGTYDALINKYSLENNIDPRLLAGIIDKESSFNPNAYNETSGARGLAQFLLSTAQDEGMSQSDLTDPEQSIKHMAIYLRKRINGEGSVKEGVKHYGENTEEYWQSVLEHASKFGYNGSSSNYNYNGSKDTTDYEQYALDAKQKALQLTNSLSDMQQQLTQIPYLIFESKLTRLFDNKINTDENKSNIDKSKMDVLSETDSKRLPLMEDILKNEADELKIYSDKEKFIQGEINSKKYTQAQVYEMNKLLDETKEKEASIYAEIVKQKEEIDKFNMDQIANKLTKAQDDIENKISDLDFKEKKYVAEDDNTGKAKINKERIKLEDQELTKLTQTLHAYENLKTTSVKGEEERQNKIAETNKKIDEQRDKLLEAKKAQDSYNISAVTDKYSKINDKYVDKVAEARLQELKYVNDNDSIAKTKVKTRTLNAEEQQLEYLYHQKIMLEAVKTTTVEGENAKIKAIEETTKAIEQQRETVVGLRNDLKDLAKQEIQTFLDKKKEVELLNVEAKWNQKDTAKQTEIYSVDKSEWEAFKKSKSNSLRDEINSLQKQAKANKDNLDIQNQLAEKQTELNTLYSENYADFTQQELYKKMSEDRIAELDKQIEKLNEQDELAKEQEERLKRQNDLIKLQTELQNIQNNKNILHLTKNADGSYQNSYEYDVDAYKQKQEEIDNAKKDNTDWESDLAKSKKIKQLEDEKQSEQNLLNAKDKYYEEYKTRADKYQEQEKKAVEQQYSDITKMTEDYLTELVKQYGNDWTTIEKLLKAKFDTISKDYTTLSNDLSKPIVLSVVDRDKAGLTNLPNATTSVTSENKTATTKPKSAELLAKEKTLNDSYAKLQYFENLRPRNTTEDAKKQKSIEMLTQEINQQRNAVLELRKVESVAGTTTTTATTTPVNNSVNTETGSIAENTTAKINEMNNAVLKAYDDLKTKYTEILKNMVTQNSKTQQDITNDVSVNIRKITDLHNAYYDKLIRLASYEKNQETTIMSQKNNSLMYLISMYLNAIKSKHAIIWSEIELNIESVFAKLKVDYDALSLALSKTITTTIITRHVDIYESSGSGADGSHADGLYRVPFDGYRSILHKDEMVLTAEEAEAYRKGENLSTLDSSLIPQIKMLDGVDFSRALNVLSNVPNMIYNGISNVVDSIKGKSNGQIINQYSFDNVSFPNITNNTGIENLIDALKDLSRITDSRK